MPQAPYYDASQNSVIQLEVLSRPELETAKPGLYLLNEKLRVTRKRSGRLLVLVLPEGVHEIQRRADGRTALIVCEPKLPFPI